MLVEKIESVTLSRFRSDENAQGGIDMIKVRDELSTSIEEKLLGIIDGMMLKFTALIGLGYCLAAVLVALALKHV